MAKKSLLTKSVPVIDVPATPPAAPVVLPVVTDVAPQGTSKVSAEARHHYAGKMADIADKDVFFRSDLEDIQVAKEVTARGPVVLYFDLLRIHGEATLKEWPRVGLHSKDVKPGDNENGIPDISPRRYTKDDGTDGSRDVSWYDDYFDALTAGKSLEAEKALIRQAKDKDNARGPYKEHLKTDLNGMLRLHTQRRSAAIGSIKKAMQVFQIMNDIRVRYEGRITVGFVTREIPNTIEARASHAKSMGPQEASALREMSDLPVFDPNKPTSTDNPKVIRVRSNTTSPIFIQDRDSPVKAKEYAVTGFIRLKVQKAIDNGGTYSSLVDSAERGTGGADSTTDGKDSNEKNIAVNNIGEAETALALLNGWLETDEHLNSVYRRLNSKNPQESDALCVTICEVYEALKPYYEKYGKRYQRLIGATEGDAEKAA